MRWSLPGIVVAILAAPAVSADKLLEQVMDGVDGYISHRWAEGTRSMADDFTIAETTRIRKVEACFGQFFEAPPTSGWELEIRTDSSGWPGQVIYERDGGAGIDTGRDFPEYEGVVGIWEVEWRTRHLTLEPGTYWLVCRGVNDFDYEPGGAFWLTANTDTPQGSQSHSRGRNGGWNPQDLSVSDCAFALHGEGAAGAHIHERARIRKIKTKDGDDSGATTPQTETSDNEFYIVDSEWTSAGKHRVTMHIVTKNRIVDAPLAVDVTVESENTNSGARSIIWIRDWTTRRWTRLGSADVGPGQDTLQRFPGLDAARYVHPDTGKILIRVRQEVANGGSFETRADLIEVRVRGD